MSQQRPRTEAELIELVRSMDVRAPESLHRRVDSLLLAHSRRRRRAGVSGALARSPSSWRGRLAAVGAAVGAIVALSTGPAGSLSLQSASALTLRPATAAAPRESKSHRDELTASV